MGRLLEYRKRATTAVYAHLEDAALRDPSLTTCDSHPSVDPELFRPLATNGETLNFDIRFPEPLRDGSLVVFAGAGNSMGRRACLPNFMEFAKSIAEGTGETQGKGVSKDAFLVRLKVRGVKVHDIAARKLHKNRCGQIPKPTVLHRNLLRLYPAPDKVRIVTTNFDLLFDDEARSWQNYGRAIPHA